MQLKIKRFDPTTLKPHRIIIIVGKRGTGKSVMQRDLMYHLRDKWDLGVAMTPTEESAQTFSQHMPENWIYNGFSSTKLDQILNMQRELCKDKKERNLFLILDDCMYDKKILKGTGIRDLFMNGRHLKLTPLLLRTRPLHLHLKKTTLLPTSPISCSFILLELLIQFCNFLLH